MDSHAKYRSSTAMKAEKALASIYMAARVGMKFSLTFLLLAEVLNRAFCQVGEEEVTRRDTGYLINILGPLARPTMTSFHMWPSGLCRRDESSL